MTANNCARELRFLATLIFRNFGSYFSEAENRWSPEGVRLTGPYSEWNVWPITTFPGVLENETPRPSRDISRIC